jgi:hypothetical protein
MAAVLLLVLGLRLEVRVEARQLLLRWGPAPPEVQPAPEPPRSPTMQPARSQPDVEEQLRVLRAVVHALVDETQQRDAQWRQALTRLQVQLDELQLTGNARWNETRKVAALVAAQINSPQKGDKQ